MAGQFEEGNGLRQGCTMAPTLFNIYFSGMVARWRVYSEVAGVTVLYSHRRRLVDDCTGLEGAQSRFADDLALYAAS